MQCLGCAEKNIFGQIKKLFMKIVIADDSSLLRERIKHILLDFNGNCEIYEAENGLDALQLIRENKPYLTILDIRMPEMNGIEVLRKVKELKINTKICILTNFPYPQYRKKCLELGAMFFLDKNLEVEKITEILLKINNNRQYDGTSTNS